VSNVDIGLSDVCSHDGCAITNNLGRNDVSFGRDAPSIRFSKGRHLFYRVHITENRQARFLPSQPGGLPEETITRQARVMNNNIVSSNDATCNYVCN